MLLSISDGARHDLNELHLYGVQHYGEHAADAYVDALVLAMEKIAEWPLAARLRAEIRPPVRLAAYAAHNILYDLSDDTVQILRVLHHSADWINSL
ncbi:MAG: type II toxin-antitoxin system RelE/ParE family toxin [Devosia nanyangense]|uniref:Type II toxin-antitoxin system RelE/ParE family toxin n=1 Tax=Devosia nanyangense TaxID=1228055 RepID=A0A933NY95_9HYPH|nr:type II toxin-antitoxin system RelE/ParE family toxin [Devosia nanyangense]